MVDQLSLEDILGPFNCEAKSTAEQCLAKPSAITSYEVHFYDQDARQKIDYFDANTENEAWKATIEEHGNSIRKIKIKRSHRTRDEFLALD